MLFNYKKDACSYKKTLLRRFKRTIDAALALKTLKILILGDTP